MRERTVYLLFAGEQLLYVGSTYNLRQRIKAHRHEKPWFPEVTRVRSKSFPTDEAARREEAALIFKHQPRHSRRGLLGASRYNRTA